MLAHRLRGWANKESTFVKRIVFAGSAGVLTLQRQSIDRCINAGSPSTTLASTASTKAQFLEFAQNKIIHFQILMFSLISVSQQQWFDIDRHQHCALQCSWAGRRGYRAPPRNQFLSDDSRLEKYRRKRFAMLKSCQNIPHTIFMKISTAITWKCMFRHISAQSADSSTFKVSNSMFWGSKRIIKLFLKWSDVSNT